MIIKSMSRKTPSFSQLVDYVADIDKADKKYSIYHNLFSRNEAKITSEFEANAKFVRQRKNGVYLYHEILSITKNQNLSSTKQKQILNKIAREYIENRANDNLVYATMHDDHDNHLHYHFIISSNKAGDSQKLRMSKHSFDKFKKDLELKVLESYPELEQTFTINKQLKSKKSSSEKLSNKAGETKRRTGKTPKRDEVKSKLQDIFNRSHTKAEFFTNLSDNNFEFYIRGKSTFGVVDINDNKKYRLKTLGVLEEFDNMSAKIELTEANAKESEKAKSYSKNARDKNNADNSSKEHTKSQQNTSSQKQEKPNNEKQEARKEDIKNFRAETSKNSHKQK